jgi:hypothetical protein
MYVSHTISSWNWWSQMANRVVKLSLQMHVKHLLNLDTNKYAFSKHHLFPFLVFNII